MSFKAHCHTYRCVDNVYMFLLEKPTMVMDKNMEVELEFLKIVAFDGKEKKK
jgi:hypothetical protein